MKTLVVIASVIALTSLTTVMADQTNQPTTVNSTAHVVTTQEKTADAMKPESEVATPAEEKNTPEALKKAEEEKLKKEALMKEEMMKKEPAAEQHSTQE